MPQNKRKYNLNQGQNWTTTYISVNESSHLSKCKDQRKPFTPQLTVMVLFLVGIPGQPPPLLKPSGPQGQRHPPPLQPQAGVPRSNPGGLQGPPPLIKPMVRPIQPQVSVLERLRLAEMSHVLVLFVHWFYAFLPWTWQGAVSLNVVTSQNSKHSKEKKKTARAVIKGSSSWSLGESNRFFIP